MPKKGKPVLRDTMRERPGNKDVRESWIEVPVEQWVIAYRLVLKEGRVAVGEIRILPNEKGHQPGRWSADPKSVPRQGLSAVVELVKLDDALSNYPRIIKHLESQWGREVVDDAWVGRFGFGEEAWEEPEHPGRGGRGHLFYAIWVDRYVSLVEEGERAPARVLAARFHKTPQAISDLIREAARRDLIEGRVRGKASGRRTEKCRRILRVEQRRKR